MPQNLRARDALGPSAIVVVMGVSGSGKTTVGQLLARSMGCAFLDGDALHSPAAIALMSRGVPLTDEDRAPWLAAIHGRMRRAFLDGARLVVACSALKQRYRDALADGVPVVWVYLKGSRELIRSRLQHRTGHFMPAALLDSQFDALEEPRGAIVADVSKPPHAIVEQILNQL